MERCDLHHTQNLLSVSSNRGFGSRTQHGHITNRYEINLEELGMCGGYVEERHCRICNAVTYVYCNDYSCNWNWQYDDADGYSVYKCNWCNAIKKYRSESTEKDENCNYTYTEECIYIVDGKEVYSGKEISNYSSHNYEYTYQFNGATCDDGYRVTYTCTDCGYSDWYTSYGHNTEYYEVDLGELGLCGGYIEECRCYICNTVTDVYNNNYCNLLWIYDDPSGYSVYKCSDCDSVWKIKENGKEYSLIIQKDGKEIYNISYTY